MRVVTDVRVRCLDFHLPLPSNTLYDVGILGHHSSLTMVSRLSAEIELLGTTPMLIASLFVSVLLVNVLSISGFAL